MHPSSVVFSFSGRLQTLAFSTVRPVACCFYASFDRPGEAAEILPACA
jgi:hypothetical protein